MGLFGKPDSKPDAKPLTGAGDGSATPPATMGNQEGGGTPSPSTPDPAASKAKASTVKAIPALAIRALPPAGFCRAGRRWTPEVQTVAVSEFTKAQVKALREETNLVVEDVEIQPEPEV
jgi:hypothetical protein